MTIFRVACSLVLCLASLPVMAQLAPETPDSPAAPAAPASPPETAPVPAAPAAPKPLAWVVELGGDFGTNELYRVTYTDGSKQVIGANTGLFLTAGVTALPLADGRLRTRAAIGIKYTGQEASNGSIDYYAFPLEVLETLDVKPVRLGAGLYIPLGQRLKGSGAASNISATFDTTVGYTVRAEWLFGQGVGFGVRYLWTKTSISGNSVDAPAFGFILSANG